MAKLPFLAIGCFRLALFYVGAKVRVYRLKQPEYCHNAPHVSMRLSPGRIFWTEHVELSDCNYEPSESTAYPRDLNETVEPKPQRIAVPKKVGNEDPRR